MNELNILGIVGSLRKGTFSPMALKAAKLLEALIQLVGVNQAGRDQTG